MIDARKFRPLGSWIVVKTDPRTKQTKGGIILTEEFTRVERLMEGTGHVLSVGRGVGRELAFPLEPGMRICYRGFVKDASSPIFEKIDDCEIFLLHARDALAVIDADTRMGAFS